MSGTIRQARKAQGLTLRELADRLGVSAAAVSQMEKSEADETIKLATLRRAHEALGSGLTVAVFLPAVSGLERREERVAWELHRVIAAKLVEDSEPILARVAENIARIRVNVRGDLPNQWLDEWARLTATSLAETVRVLLDTSQYGIEMRQNGPFLGVLTQAEREAAIAREA